MKESKGVESSVKEKTMKIHDFSVLIEKDEDGYYVATVPALRSCYTQARELEELYPRIREVIELCFEEGPSVANCGSVKVIE
jgi:predicted RNase H-like HicB family nuclease